MTREEAIKKANDKLGNIIYLSECSANPGLRKVYGNMAEWLSKVVYLAEIGLKIQQKAEKNEPLTLDELQEMDGEPVWVSYINHIGEDRWRIVELSTGIGLHVESDPHFCLRWDMYGKSWVAYRRKRQLSARMHPALHGIWRELPICQI